MLKTRIFFLIPAGSLTHTKKPLFLRASELCSKYNLPHDVLSDNAPYFPPPWVNFQKYISTNFGITKKRDVDNSSIRGIFQDMLSTTYQNFYKFYTDGSKKDDAVGSAVFIEDSDLVLSWKIGSDHSVLVAELFAIYNCLTWMLQRENFGSVVIFSDSLSALNLVGCAVIKSHFHFQNSKTLTPFFSKWN